MLAVRTEGEGGAALGLRKKLLCVDVVGRPRPPATVERDLVAGHKDMGAVPWSPHARPPPPPPQQAAEGQDRQNVAVVLQGDAQRGGATSFSGELIMMSRLPAAVASAPVPHVPPQARLAIQSGHKQLALALKRCRSAQLRKGAWWKQKFRAEALSRGPY